MPSIRSPWPRSSTSSCQVARRSRICWPRGLTGSPSAGWQSTPSGARARCSLSGRWITLVSTARGSCWRRSGYDVPRQPSGSAQPTASVPRSARGRKIGENIAFSSRRGSTAILSSPCGIPGSTTQRSCRAFCSRRTASSERERELAARAFCAARCCRLASWWIARSALSTRRFRSCVMCSTVWAFPGRLRGISSLEGCNCGPREHRACRAPD
mmetsp:Transcript_64762/g.174123  ORF Transcript_64762/g.174123 Transcript_64762/m.174123 type:complete len:213 (+) Transcript_64762:56-694(+)